MPVGVHVNEIVELGPGIEAELRRLRKLK
jgi:hypothetical protein